MKVVSQIYSEVGKQRIVAIATRIKQEFRCSSLRSFEALINDYWAERKARGFPVTVKTNYNTLRFLLKGEFSDETLEAIAPFTGLSDVDLKKIARDEQPQSLEDLISIPSAIAMQAHPNREQSMSDLPPDLPQLPSLISGLLLDLIESTDLDRVAIAKALSVSRHRVEALIAQKTPISLREYGAIAKLLNQQCDEGIWTAEILQQEKERWDRLPGHANNGNGN